MPSPFPGMNPYLEQADVWNDFHKRLIAAIAEMLAAQVDPSYIVKIDLHTCRTETLGYVEIRDRPRRKLVTTIEVLTPDSKRDGTERDKYLAERTQSLASFSHFVECDLLRGGIRMPLTGLPSCDYCVMVSRAQERPLACIWPVGLRDRLPRVPIPLSAPDVDAMLDIQSALHHVYDAARYQTYIYDGSPEPPLSPANAAWASTYLPTDK